MVDEKTIHDQETRLDQAHAFLHIEEKQTELKKLDDESAAADFWNDPDHAQQVSKRASDLRDLLAAYKRARSLADDCRAALELAQEDPEFAADAEAASHNEGERMGKHDGSEARGMHARKAGRHEA